MIILRASSILSRSLNSSCGRQSSASGLVLSCIRKVPTSSRGMPASSTHFMKSSTFIVPDISTNLNCSTCLILGSILARISSTSVDPECTSSNNNILHPGRMTCGDLCSSGDITCLMTIPSVRNSTLVCSSFQWSEVSVPCLNPTTAESLGIPQTSFVLRHTLLAVTRLIWVQQTLPAFGCTCIAANAGSMVDFPEPVVLCAIMTFFVRNFSRKASLLFQTGRRTFGC